MAKTVKLTQKQIKESESIFSFLYNTDTTTCDGNSKISVTGKLNGKTDGKPYTTDKFASMNCPQAYNRYGSYGYRYGRGNELKEDANNDEDNDGVDDFYNNTEIDILSNGNKADNLVKIPQGIDNKVNILVNACQTLTPKQKAIVLNKILENFDISSLSYNIKKLLLKKLIVKK